MLLFFQKLWMFSALYCSFLYLIRVKIVDLKANIDN